ncbi:hypothetical protein G6F43_011023 [Rhizopus delemar]|nr:hypothetical protein G6F43_011023 [Rhizopus delemar]
MNNSIHIDAKAGYGTVDRSWSSEAPDDELPKRTSKRNTCRAFRTQRRIWSTVSHRHSPRKIKGDLNDV